ncbi:hypothetical protein LSH36_233g06043 [Paralvinella palmiformis]|uniref:Uncharacterized protein n=1 Tax=Paralvinella palmiformis TaxID=53620 RepID=A0AAD9N3U2_9ANNE|nr:hypothetical protein LSH36_233g06043 [Paralvinella palmiformis]
MTSSKSSPKDAQVMAATLKDMGVAEYEPRVINQMLEFTYRYVTDILDDAKVYSAHANKKNIDTEDVRLAIQCKLDHSFTTPPPRDLLMDIARHKNTNPLPLIKPYTGIKLPPDRYCLAQANYRLKPLKKNQPQIVQVSGASILPNLTPRVAIHSAGTSLVKTSSLGGTGSLQLVTRGVSQPTVTIRPAVASTAATGSTPVPIIRLTPGNTMSASSTALGSGTSIIKVESLKRKREDEDDYDKM